MLSRFAAVLLLISVGIYFLISSEEGGAVSLFGWLRDPESSRREHASWVESERVRAADALEADRELRGLTMIDDVGPGQDALDAGPLELRGDEAARALAGAEDEDNLDSLRAASSVPLRGVVVAPDGRPLAGVTVGASQPGGHEGRAETDARGLFEMRLHGAAGTLAFDDRTWVAVGGELGLAPGLNVGRDVRVLVLVPRADLSGRTLHADGRPLAGARVVAAQAFDDVPEALRDLLPASFEVSARSDAEGRWLLAPLPDLPDLRVRIEAEGCTPVERTAAELRESGDVTLLADRE
ncbi:MAG TPA: carboxypeptidase-like regulatory domain-containing protein [Planctomycetota bacterium]|nr:carboxypeptidase-like regulatory domain-containing protein [Planctomycetota bacterium]